MDHGPNVDIYYKDMHLARLYSIGTYGWNVIIGVA